MGGIACEKRRKLLKNIDFCGIIIVEIFMVYRMAMERALRKGISVPNGILFLSKLSESDMILWQACICIVETQCAFYLVN